MMVSMKQDAKAATEDYGVASNPGDAPLYPYGLSLCLNDETLKKLSMGLPEVGGKFLITAMVECTRASANKDQDGTEISADLQITDMEITTPDGGDAARASKLYPDSN